MNHWWWPGGGVLGLGLATAVASLLGPQPLPAPPGPDQPTRISVACPAIDAASATVEVAAVTAGDALSWARVAAPGKTTVGGRSLLLAVTEPLRISAAAADPFGTLTVATAPAGPDRGRSAVACQTPRSEHWFTGLDLGADAQAELLLVNLDASPAVVDLAVLGEHGRVPAPRGIPVPANGVTRASLAALPRQAAPAGLRVSTSDGRVAAFVRQRLWSGSRPLGGDWLPGAAEPRDHLVLPGLPAGPGARRLVVTNPGQRTAAVAIELLGSAGPVALAGAEQLEVPAGTTRSLELAPGLAGQEGGVRLRANQPVTAAVAVDSGGPDRSRDHAHLSSTEPVPEQGRWPLPGGTGVTIRLLISNAGDAEARVAVAAGDQAATGVVVPAGASVGVELAAADRLELQTSASSVHAALVVTGRVGPVRSLALAGLSPGEGQRPGTQVSYDPRPG